MAGMAKQPQPKIADPKFAPYHTSRSTKAGGYVPSKSEKSGPAK